MYCTMTQGRGKEKRTSNRSFRGTVQCNLGAQTLGRFHHNCTVMLLENFNIRNFYHDFTTTCFSWEVKIIEVLLSYSQDTSSCFCK